MLVTRALRPPSHACPPPSPGVRTRLQLTDSRFSFFSATTSLLWDLQVAVCTCREFREWRGENRGGEAGVSTLRSGASAMLRCLQCWGISGTCPAYTQRSTAGDSGYHSISCCSRGRCLAASAAAWLLCHAPPTAATGTCGPLH